MSANLGPSPAQLAAAEANIKNFQPSVVPSDTNYNNTQQQLNQQQQQIQPASDQAFATANTINDSVNGRLTPPPGPQMGGAPAIPSGQPVGQQQMVKVKNNQTGQIMLVPVGQLGQYGLSAPGGASGPSFSNGQPAIVQNSQSASQIPGGVNPQSPQEANQQQQTLDEIQSLPAAQGSALADEYKATYGYAPGEQKPLTAQQQQSQDLAQQHIQTKTSLQDLLSSYLAIPDSQKGRANPLTMAGGIPLIGKGIEGFTAPDAQNYVNQVRALAATVSPVAGGGEGTGLRTTAPELAGWSNLLPNPGASASVNQNNVKLLDEQMRGKFNGQGLDASVLKQYGISYNKDGSYTLANANQTQAPNWEERLATGAKNDITSLPGNIANAGKNIAQQDQQNHLGIPANTALTLGKGALNEAEALAPISFKNGQPVFDPGKTGNQILDHPINTALAVAPFVPKGLEVVGDALKGADDTDTASLATLPEGGRASFAKGLATNIAVPDESSVINSENLMGKALQMTNSTTVRGMAKELEESVPKIGGVIAKHAENLDSQIGLQPLNEIIDQVMNKLQNNSAAQANPQLTQVIRTQLENQLSAGSMGKTGISKGELQGTNFSRMNDARIYLNRGLSGWFKNGQPTGTPTNDLNALKWEASNALKDTMAQGDKTGVFKQAIDNQHTALSTAPVLSKAALTGGTKVTNWETLLKKGYEGTVGHGVERGKIATLRGMLGKGKGISFKGGKMPITPPVSNEDVVQQNAPFTASPIPKVNPITPTSNGVRLNRDMRFKIGNPRFKK